MNYYQRKLYALLHMPETPSWTNSIYESLSCFTKEERDELELWWQEQVDEHGLHLAQRLAASSDRVNLSLIAPAPLRACHPISGKHQPIADLSPPPKIPVAIQQEACAQKVFWWFWRFYPERLGQEQEAQNALLFPAQTILPDCPLHSYQSTVSALVGAMFPKDWQGDTQNVEGDRQSTQPETPYLLLFSFSPVQEFIKASRKFLDFWAGSYLLHYLSAKLCWHIAQEYGPDAVIVPSLWNQEIFDALLIQRYPFTDSFTGYGKGGTPVQRFDDRLSTSLSTAGFPNMITAIVPGKAAAQTLGKDLAEKLSQLWCEAGKKVRNHIRDRVIQTITNFSSVDRENLWQELGVAQDDRAAYEHDLNQWLTASCWEWGPLWNAQLENTWEPYWTAIPLAKPGELLEIIQTDEAFDPNWLKLQQQISQAEIELPAEAEKQFPTLNVGSWWGSIQQRLRITLQQVKNTRNWQIPTAPGERSTISGQFAAVHPRLNYTKFAEGGGLPEGSMRLFAQVLAKAYPGLFNGSERLNALELTKRMAWFYGGISRELGITTSDLSQETDYDDLIRFPNLSSIAAARFAYEHPNLVKKYSQRLIYSVRKKLLQAPIKQNASDKPEVFQAAKKRRKSQHKKLSSRTYRPFQVTKTDAQVRAELGKHYNGMMFSSKWLAEDLELTKDEIPILRHCVEQAHQNSGFSNGSPGDWWAIVLADGDSMGGYVSGHKLEKYEKYLNLPDPEPEIPGLADLKHTKKRMGPATHVGLNRALLDFSNRLVPYLTERRFCGRVIYSGGDDVMAVLPIEDLPEYLISLRAAWCAGEDRYPDPDITFQSQGDYWKPRFHGPGAQDKLPDRPLFTMGHTATMSMGIVIAHKSVPLPTVLESLWTAEKDRAKEIPEKDGLCFRVIYGGGNQLEALMKGKQLAAWWHWIEAYLSEWQLQFSTNSNHRESLSPLLHRLSEELPQRAIVTNSDQLVSKVAQVIMRRREDVRDRSDGEMPAYVGEIVSWLNQWEKWAWQERVKVKKEEHASDEKELPLGTSLQELGKLLRFTAFWIDRRVERYQWGDKPQAFEPVLQEGMTR